MRPGRASRFPAAAAAGHRELRKRSVGQSIRGIDARRPPAAAAAARTNGCARPGNCIIFFPRISAFLFNGSIEYRADETLVRVRQYIRGGDGRVKTPRSGRIYHRAGGTPARHIDPPFRPGAGKISAPMAGRTLADRRAGGLPSRTARERRPPAERRLALVRRARAPQCDRYRPGGPLRIHCGHLHGRLNKTMRRVDEPPDDSGAGRSVRVVRRGGGCARVVRSVFHRAPVSIETGPGRRKSSPGAAVDVWPTAARSRGIIALVGKLPLGARSPATTRRRGSY